MIIPIFNAEFDRNQMYRQIFLFLLIFNVFYFLLSAESGQDLDAHGEDTELHDQNPPNPDMNEHQVHSDGNTYGDAENIISSDSENGEGDPDAATISGASGQNQDMHPQDHSGQRVFREPENVVEMDGNFAEDLKNRADNALVNLRQLEGQKVYRTSDEMASEKYREQQRIYENEIDMIKKYIGELNIAAESLNYDLAIMELGNIYFYGLYGQPKDLHQAFHWFRSAALKTGNETAHFMTALFYSTGLTDQVPQDQAKAMLHHFFGAIGNSIESNMALGYRHHMGIGTPRSCSNALSYYYSASKSTILGQINTVPPPKTSILPKTRIPDEFGGVYEINPNIGIDKAISQDDIIQFYKFNAEKGDINAQLTLGQIYYHGTPTTMPNFEKALRYLRAATSQLPDPTDIVQNTKSASDVVKIASQAASVLGQMFWRGEGVRKDPKKAFKWFHRSASHGNAAAMNYLGLMYQHGVVVPQNIDKARQFFLKAAEKDNADAQANLALTYLDKTRPDYAAAYKYFSLSLRQGNLVAMHYLGLMYHKGLGVAHSCSTALSFYKNAVERGDQNRPYLFRGYKHYLISNYLGGNKDQMELSLLNYLIGAEMGYEAAQTNVAWLLDKKKFSFEDPLRSAKLSIIYWNRAANQGNVEARVKMGDYYYYGNLAIGNPDYKLAASYYQSAEAEMSAMAMFNLGFMHENGVGVEKDYHLAKRYYNRALKTDPSSFLALQLALWKLHIKHFFYWVRNGGSFYLDAPADIPQKANKEDPYKYSLPEEDQNLADILRQHDELLKAPAQDPKANLADNDGEDGMWAEDGEIEDDDSDLMIMAILVIITALLMWIRVRPAARPNFAGNVWDQMGNQFGGAPNAEDLQPNANATQHGDTMHAAQDREHDSSSSSVPDNDIVDGRNRTTNDETSSHNE